MRNRNIRTARPVSGDWRIGALLAAALAALVACSETPLNDAPVIDRSVGSPHARIAAEYAAGAAPSAAGAEALYTVQKGDTLYRLAAQANISVADLARWNGIEEGTPIFVGQQLQLHAPAPAVAAAGVPPASGEDASGGAEAVVSAIAPATEGVQTHPLEPPAPEAGATVAPPGTGTGAAPALRAAPPPVPAPPAAAAPTTAAADSTGAASGAASGATAGATAGGAGAGPGAAPTGSPPASAPAATGWIWPVNGTVSRRFDGARNKGIDIAVAEDAPVVAVADGTVSYTGSPRDFGKLVVLKHGDELLSVYSRNKSILVKEGQFLHQGQVLATAGASGSGAPLLHFEVRRNRVAVDPLELLPPR